MTQHVFQTEVQQLLQLMIHSLYSEREIFLRELISNASDALDKLRFKSLTDAALMRGDENLHVDILPDEEHLSLVIQDNGIGMTEAEAVEHLGTIAKSGTKAFLKSLGEDASVSAEQKKDANLIGQFGVGFYSAFMVADRIVVESRGAGVGSEQGVRWESTGDGNFSTETITRAQRGTTITLHFKEDAKEFLGNWKLRELIKKYSDYVAYPVRLPKYLSDEDKKKEVKAELEQVNAGQALWTRPKDQITDEQYQEFYKTACKQWDSPATRLHFSVEGTLSFTALLFVPSQKPMDLFDRERRGLSLYVRRVFVMDDCRDLLPEYLRFVRGVVDSDDLPLNVSREILQQQDTVVKLRKQLVKRILDHLLKLASSSDEADTKAFTAIDANFGAILREGLVPVMRDGQAPDADGKDRVARLVRYRSTFTVKPKEGHEQSEEAKTDAAATKTGFEDYVRRMPEGQKSIYYITAQSLEAAKASPHLEGFARKGYEVLFMTDQVDEWVSGHFHEFDGRQLVSVAKGQDELASDEDKKRIEEQEKTYGGFIGFVKEALADDVGDVRLSTRLTDSPCCLVGEEHSLTPQMEELMRRMGQDVPRQKRVLELNAAHPLVEKLQASHAAKGDPEQLKRFLQVMRDQAILAEGGRLADSAGFAKRVQELLLGAVGPTGGSANVGSQRSVSAG